MLEWVQDARLENPSADYIPCPFFKTVRNELVRGHQHH